MSESMIVITIEKLDEGGYLATSKTLQGLIAQGGTIADTIEIAQDVAKKLIESCIEYGDSPHLEWQQIQYFTKNTS